VTATQENDMKLVTAIVRPHAADNIKDGLQQLGIEGLTLTEVRGYGRQRGHTEIYRGAEYTVEFVPKVRLEVLCTEERANDVVDTIIKYGRSGQVGDGKVFVTPVDRVVRIRTGEEDHDAL
jgi:nitrogen regulatory protein P-II 1